MNQSPRFSELHSGSNIVIGLLSVDIDCLGLNFGVGYYVRGHSKGRFIGLLVRGGLNFTP